MKTSAFALNAVYAKIHCLYAKRLTYRNYNELLAMRSVGEIAEYLKTKTAYSEIFEGVSTDSYLGRSRLENMLFNKLFNEFSSAARFQKAAGGVMYEYFLMKYDTAQIINVLSSLNTKSDDYFFTFPAFYNEKSKLDLYALAKAKNEEEILDCTKNTVYYGVLRDALSDYRISGNLTAVQAKLAAFLDEEFIKLSLGKKKNFAENDELGNLCKTFKDVALLKSVYRLQRFSRDDSVSEKIIYPVLSRFTKKQLDEIIGSKDRESLVAAVSKTYLSEIFANDGEDAPKKANEFLFETFEKTVRRSTDSGAVMFAYLWLAENEIKNIIHIIEGIRYGMSAIEILPMLCGVSSSQ